MDEMRKAFEAWATAEPREWDVTRFDEGSARWPGQYFGYVVQVSWEAWQAACAAEREACAEVCETTVWSKYVTWWTEATKTQVSAEASQQCAAAIRARSQQ